MWEAYVGRLLNEGVARSQKFEDTVLLFIGQLAEALSVLQNAPS